MYSRKNPSPSPKPSLSPLSHTMSGGGGGEIAGESSETLIRDDAPKLLAVLKEMKGELDVVRSKVETLTQKVKQNKLPTADGIGYLEAKHLLLLSYCQSIVYYLLRKAKGLSIESHPVMCSLVEIRLFLEKIRPIVKKMEYQIQKLTKAADGTAVQERSVNIERKRKDGTQEEEDPLKYRPNPDMLVSKSATDGQDNVGVYRPPRFMPTSMDEDKQEKQALRRKQAAARLANQDIYLKELAEDIADKPEELKETIGDESREFTRYMQKREALEKQEEEHFTRSLLTRRDKQEERRMKRLTGLRGLSDGFLPGMNILFPGEQEDTRNGNDGGTSHRDAYRGGRRDGDKRKHKKRKRH